MGQAIDSEPQATLIEVDVTRLDDSVAHRDRPVAMVSPAAIPAAAKLEISRAEKSRSRSYHTLLQGRQSYQGLVGGTGRIDAADSAVEHGMVAITGQGLPFFLFHATNELLLIKARTAGHGQNRSTPGIEGDDGPHLTFKTGFRHLLKLEIDG